MRLDVLPGCIFRMFVGMGIVTVGHVGMMSRLFMVAGFVMLCSLGMVVCSLRMVMGSLLVMMRRFFRHDSLLFCSRTDFVVRKPVWHHQLSKRFKGYGKFK